MTLEEKIAAEVITALKSGDQKTAGLLRFLTAQIKNKGIENRAAGKPEALSDEEVLEIFRREAKKRKEAIALYEQGGRPELAAAEKEELVMIEKYLPAQMDKEGIRAVVREVKSAAGNEFSSVMKESMARLKGKADGKLVSEVIKEELQ